VPLAIRPDRIVFLTTRISYQVPGSGTGVRIVPTTTTGSTSTGSH